ncbi:bilirubin oxidase precursor [Neurospora crassa]|uniref:Bilirubin oxidase n=1 Tax=Neurospora crassa (strain ATCC 24698 / 74-OR23-1A / CBS 708.71 / DSM 1257 / FGSC 987) TaxID=367110 RepID=Q7RX46_NEUCR|nr:bilirubin oxidase [Neurospora crassa OR74A]EAA27114.3 bilirubin oxidase [Neurospora crassa OR74A]KHE83825.1 bilirubin oxidase precursor [Neurospora crassa]|eukprot:XP_956350.3 bilirubin oxidase [Neurospora crassa OR74A]
MASFSLSQTLLFLVLVLSAVQLGSVSAGIDKWLSPPYKWTFQFPLPIPPVKAPSKTIVNPITGKNILYYEVEIKEFKSQVYPDRGPATLWGYDGMSPGPTFIVEKGTETVVRFVNNARLANSVHLHGSYSRAPFDGWAEDITPPGWYKDYYYPNSQSGRTLWYHDHAIDHTAENAYYGQAGAYILHDPSIESPLGLPSGYGTFDIPLILSAKQYTSSGSLFSPADETTSLYGDVIHVNGQPWPFLNVEPRKYRFRFLDASISRSFLLYFERDAKVGGTKLPFDVIASDAGLLNAPQRVNELYISMAERYEVVVDFGGYKGENITLKNARDVGADRDFPDTDKVMRFVVSDVAVVDDESSRVPAVLRSVPFPKTKTQVDQHFKFERSNGEWKINGVSFADVANRVLARPKRGTVEVWELENSSGGWTHPIHIHLVDFRVKKRVNGKRSVLPYEAQGLKDVVWLGPGETVTVEAHYAPWDGVYMFHCHNLIHEDHEMMAAFNVSVLQDLGYDETHYIDPMEARWRARQQSVEAFDDSAVEARVKEMAGFRPYDKVEEVESVLDQYWETKTKAGSTATQVVPTTISAGVFTTSVKASTTSFKTSTASSSSSTRTSSTSTKRKD